MIEIKPQRGKQMADFKFTCPHCKQNLEAPEDMAGESLACPACEELISIPDEESQRKGVLTAPQKVLSNTLSSKPPPSSAHQSKRSPSSESKETARTQQETMQKSQEPTKISPKVPDGVGCAPPNGSQHAKTKGRTRQLKVLGVLGSLVLFVCLGYHIWPGHGTHIEGYYDATRVGEPKNAPCVWAFESNGYVTMYGFIDRNNLILQDGTCRLGKRIDPETYEISFDGDLPTRGTGEMKAMPHAKGESPDGFIVTVNGSKTEFRGTNAKEFASILGKVTQYFNFRKTHKNREWQVVDSSRQNRVGK